MGKQNPSSRMCVYTCRGVGCGVEGSRLEAWMESHKSEVAITDNITFICTPTRKQCLCWKRHKQTKHLEHESKCKV